MLTLKSSTLLVDRNNRPVGKYISYGRSPHVMECTKRACAFYTMQTEGMRKCGDTELVLTMDPPASHREGQVFFLWYSKK